MWFVFHLLCAVDGLSYIFIAAIIINESIVTVHKTSHTHTHTHAYIHTYIPFSNSSEQYRPEKQKEKKITDRYYYLRSVFSSRFPFRSFPSLPSNHPLVGRYVFTGSNDERRRKEEGMMMMIAIDDFFVPPSLLLLSYCASLSYASAGCV